MGLAAARYLPKEKTVILSGRTLSKLESGVNELRALGYAAYAKACDTSDRDSVKALAGFACTKGEIKNCINCAGLSPAMSKPEKLLRVNALGTVYVNQEFAKVMPRGSVVVDIASNSGYILPKFLANKKTYALAETDEALFLKKLMAPGARIRDPYKSAGLAYAFSKNFVIWYAAKCAFDFGPRGIRVVSLSPGLVSTAMGNLEETKDGASLIRYTAENRMGTPDELGYAIATAADERNGYLAGVDILCDGGSIHGKKYRR